MSDVPHMSADEFREAGYRIVDWIADYWDRIEDFPVLSPAGPGEIRAKLPETPPEAGEDWDDILADVDRVVLPGITHWQSPSFFAFFPANASGPAVLGDLLSAGLGVQGMIWATSPACTEIETHVLDWLVDMLGLPDRFRSTGSGGGVIQDSASSSSLVALLAARERATDGDSSRIGTGHTLVAYASDQAHSSIEKAVRIAGIGSDNFRSIPSDADFAMRPDALEARIRADLEQGLTPAFVCATIGTTPSTAVDPVREIGEICGRYGIWLHVDAAFAGTAALLPEMRWIHDGVELADSYVFNPHKWMLTNFDLSAFYVADRSALVSALSVLPEYLRNAATESGAVIDYRDWQVPLGRRFRALKLWFVIRHYGVAGLRAHVAEHLELARWFCARVEENPRFELAAPAPLSMVCFRHRDGDEATRRVMETVNGSGDLYLTHATLGGRMALRMAIGGSFTDRRHVEDAWERISEAAG